VLRSARRLSLCLAAVVFFLPGASLAVSPRQANRGASWISIFPDGVEALLREQGVAVWTRQPGFVVGAATDAAIAALSEKGIAPIAEVRDDGSWLYLFHHRPGFASPPIAGAAFHPLSPEADLVLIPSGAPAVLPRVKPNGAFQGVPRLPLPPKVTHPAVKDFHRLPRQMHVHLLVHQCVRHAVVLALHFDVIVDVYTSGFPFSELIAQ
jgi:hypothetical protein